MLARREVMTFISHVGEWFQRRLSAQLLKISFSQGMTVASHYHYRSPILTLLEQQWIGAAMTVARNDEDTSLVLLLEAALQKPFSNPEGIRYLLNNGHLPISQMPLPCLVQFSFPEYVKERGAPVTALVSWNRVLASKGSSLLDEPHPKFTAIYDGFDFTTLEPLSDGIGIDIGPLILFYCKRFNRPYPPVRNYNKKAPIFYPPIPLVQPALPADPRNRWPQRALVPHVPKFEDAQLSPILEASRTPSPVPPKRMLEESPPFPSIFNFFPFDRTSSTETTSSTKGMWLFREMSQAESN
jgi:hypothetical protein